MRRCSACRAQLTSPGSRAGIYRPPPAGDSKVHHRPSRRRCLEFSFRTTRPGPRRNRDAKPLTEGGAGSIIGRRPRGKLRQPRLQCQEVGGRGLAPRRRRAHGSPDRRNLQRQRRDRAQSIVAALKPRNPADDRTADRGRRTPCLTSSTSGARCAVDMPFGEEGHPPAARDRLRSDLRPASSRRSKMLTPGASRRRGAHGGIIHSAMFARCCSKIFVVADHARQPQRLL
jgi:hypothetical protein